MKFKKLFKDKYVKCGTIVGFLFGCGIFIYLASLNWSGISPLGPGGSSPNYLVGFVVFGGFGAFIGMVVGCVVSKIKK